MLALLWHHLNITKLSPYLNQDTFYLPETLELFCALEQPWLWRRLRQNVVPIPRRGDMAQTRPPRPPCVAMITASIIPELRLFTCAPPPFSREDKPPDKGIQKCQKLQHPFFRNCVTLLQNCIIHHISVKNASFIQHHMRHGLDSWEIAGLDPHSNCGGFDESICRLVSSACVTGANCVCIGFIISNITCRPTLPQWCVI